MLRGGWDEGLGKLFQSEWVIELLKFADKSLLHFQQEIVSSISHPDIVLSFCQHFTDKDFILI